MAVRRRRRTRPIALLVAALALLSPFGLSPVEARQRPLSAAALRGTWRGPRGVVRVWPVDATSMRVEFYGLYAYDTPGGPIANLGEARGVARVEGVALVLVADGTNDCSLALRLTNGRLAVSQSGVCPFGQHVTSEGEYRRTSARKPRFGVQP